MAKKSKPEAAPEKAIELIPVEKLTPANFFRFSDVKEKALSEIKQFPLIEIEDNKTAKVARSHRTALKSLRVEYKNERTNVTRMVNSFKTEIQSKYDEIIAIVDAPESEQQAIIDKWDEEQAEEKNRKEAEEKEREEAFMKTIENHRISIEEIIRSLTVANMVEMEDKFAAIKTTEEDFEEFEVLFRDMLQEKELEFVREKAMAETREENRVLLLERDETQFISEMKERFMLFINDSDSVLNEVHGELQSKLRTLNFNPEIKVHEWMGIKTELLSAAKKKEAELEESFRQKQEMLRLQELEKISKVQDELQEIVDKTDQANFGESVKKFNQKKEELNSFKVATEKASSVFDLLVKKMGEREAQIERIYEENKLNAYAAETTSRIKNLEVNETISRDEYSENFKANRKIFVEKLSAYTTIPEKAKAKTVEVLEVYDAMVLQLLSQKKAIDDERAKLLESRKKRVSKLKKSHSGFEILFHDENWMKSASDEDFEEAFNDYEELMKAKAKTEADYLKRQKKLSKDKKAIQAYIDTLHTFEGTDKLINPELSSLVTIVNSKINELREELTSLVEDYDTVNE